VQTPQGEMEKEAKIYMIVADEALETLMDKPIIQKISGNLYD